MMHRGDVMRGERRDEGEKEGGDSYYILYAPVSPYVADTYTQ